jgi:hypothetical protein
MILAFSFSPLLIIVVIQDYELYVHHSHVIKGNDIIFKCDIPSFVSDLVFLFNWEDNENNVYQSLSASNYGKLSVAEDN